MPPFESGRILRVHVSVGCVTGVAFRTLEDNQLIDLPSNVFNGFESLTTLYVAQHPYRCCVAETFAERLVRRLEVFGDGSPSTMCLMCDKYAYNHIEMS